MGIVIDGCPAGLPISQSDFVEAMLRRKGHNQAGTTPRKEEDIPDFISGVYNNKTTGTPLTIVFANNNTRSSDYDDVPDTPRPGHADWVATMKFGGYNDHRGGGHFSGRLTVALVAAGVVAKKLLGETVVEASLVSIAGETDLEKGLAKGIEAKDSVGGIVSCKVSKMPVGLGEPFFNSVESLIAHGVFSIPAVKGIEFGAGFKAAEMFGSQHNDAIIDAAGTTATNHAGGVVGGLSNGNDLLFRVVIKPTSSTPKEQMSWNNKLQEVAPLAVRGRHDLCIALRAPVVIESVTALVLADLMMQEGLIKRRM